MFSSISTTTAIIFQRFIWLCTFHKILINHIIIIQQCTTLYLLLDLLFHNFFKQKPNLNKKHPSDSKFLVPGYTVIIKAFKFTLKAHIKSSTIISAQVSTNRNLRKVECMQLFTLHYLRRTLNQMITLMKTGVAPLLVVWNPVRENPICKSFFYQNDSLIRQSRTLNHRNLDFYIRACPYLHLYTSYNVQIDKRKIPDL